MHVLYTSIENFHHVLIVLDIGVCFQHSTCVARSSYYVEKPVLVLNSTASFDIEIKLFEENHTAFSKSWTIHM